MIGFAQVLACDRSDLILRWRRTFGTSPPKHTSTAFLRKVLAHQAQLDANVDVPKRARNVLNAALRSGQASMSSAAAPNLTDPSCSLDLPDPPSRQQATNRLPIILSPGVQLVREWNGRTWQVDVLDDGFTCRGKHYRSLSAIARMITGTRWSGPRFFGLT